LTAISLRARAGLHRRDAALRAPRTAALPHLPRPVGGGGGSEGGPHNRGAHGSSARGCPAGGAACGHSAGARCWVSTHARVCVCERVCGCVLDLHERSCACAFGRIGMSMPMPVCFLTTCMWPPRPVAATVLRVCVPICVCVLGCARALHVPVAATVLRVCVPVCVCVLGCVRALHVWHEHGAHTHTKTHACTHTHRHTHAHTHIYTHTHRSSAPTTSGL